jgi:two-component system chemotaxis response regulator CheB
MEFDQKIKVLIVEDSIVGQELLTQLINKDPTLKVIHKVKSAEDALIFLETATPDVISIDINLPGMDGYQLTRRIMDSNPIPIVIISGNYSSTDIHKSFKAIEAGAVSILQKPKGPADPQFSKMSDNIRSHLKMASRTKSRLSNLKENSLTTHAKKPPAHISNTKIQCIAFGGSLGGPKALRTIFAKLPKSFPVPIFVVQHISPGFSKGMVEWLQQGTELGVCLGEDRQKAQPGIIYMAPDRHHMLVDSQNIIHLEPNAKPNEIQPAVAQLFHSVAKAHGSKSIAVILTGMGSDGAKELLLIKEKGAVTIAQDKETSIMFGMPSEAIKLGAATYVTPLEEIADQIIKSLYM